MRVVFMGTPDFAVPSLEQLIKDGHEVVGVFAQPDKPKGRGYKLAAPPVKEAALAHQLPVYQPAKMRDGEALAILQELKPEIIVVVAYGKILPKEILDLPEKGCINVHGSLLPKYRGAGPIQWAVINGEKTTGVTTMYMGEGLDTGDIILKEETEIGENETYGELSDRLCQIGAHCLSETMKLIEAGTAVREVQKEEESSYAPMLNKEIAKVDFSRPAEELHHLICGLSPWPVAYTDLDGTLLKIHRAVKAEGKGKPGELLDKKRMIIACGEGALELTEVQLAGSKRMAAGDFLRGKQLPVGKILGSGQAE